MSEINGIMQNLHFVSSSKYYVPQKFVCTWYLDPLKISVLIKERIIILLKFGMLLSTVIEHWHTAVILINELTYEFSDHKKKIIR